VASIIHIPFKQEPLRAAITKFDHEDLPPGPLAYYSLEAYRNWGIAT
jgi:hypothetical protein